MKKIGEILAALRLIPALHDRMAGMEEALTAALSEVHGSLEAATEERRQAALIESRVRRLLGNAATVDDAEAGELPPEEGIDPGQLRMWEEGGDPLADDPSLPEDERIARFKAREAAGLA